MRKLTVFTAFLIYSGFIFSYNTSKEPGDTADDFALQSWDQNSYSLSEELNSGRVVVVMFWSAQCPVVRAYNERAKELNNQFQEKDITFWAVNSNSTESMQDVESQAKEFSYPFPVLKDPNNKIADMFGAQRTPEIYVIGKNRVILYHGRIDDSKDESQVTINDLKNALNEIVSGKDVSVKVTKFFGCSIKRSGQDN